MKLLVGLGNTGQAYLLNRHNFGFMAVDFIKEKYDFPEYSSKFNALISKGKIDDIDALIIKPQTFMNKSGISVAGASKFYNITPENILVFHDELDITPLTIKYKVGGGHAGHNGLRDIIEHIGANFNRLRLGIGRVDDKNMVANYVLSNFSKAELNEIPNILNYIASNINMLLNNNAYEFIKQYKTE